MGPSPTVRRLLKETSELSSTSKNPNPAFHAAPVSDTDLHEWHFTLLGPPAPSPYAGGLYHGRISLPPSYPLKPPNFRFLTPSGRFEVNREICLSISGFHEETWMPAWGVRTALTALRSFMAESGTAGQVGGLEASKEVRERLAKESRSWKCKECGSRSNEEIMSEWWEACAERGVKVGEDIGLEALPEGLNLEAKSPQKNEDKGKGREEIAPGGVVNSNTQPNPQERSEDGTTFQSSTIPAGSSSIPQPTQTQTQTRIQPLEQSTMPSTPKTQSRSNHQTNPSITSATSNTTPSRPSHQHSTSTSSTSIPIYRNTPTQPPLQNQRSRDQDQATATLTIDRAIYVVFVALFIMIIKKVFYPAGGKADWEDYAMVRE